MSASSASYAKRIAVALALAVPNAGFAATCDATLIPTASMARLDYDPFAFTRPVERITFEVESRANAACEVEFVLLDQTRTAVSSTMIGSSGVQVGFIASTGDAALVPTAVPGTWRASLQPGTRTRLAIQAIVTQDAVASAGEHATPLSLELRDVGALATTVAPMPVSVVLAVVPRAQMNIVGAIATFGQGQSVAQVDFGVLASNATRRVFLQIRADTAARLTIDSANAGRFRGAERRSGRLDAALGRHRRSATDVGRHVAPARRHAGRARAASGGHVYRHADDRPQRALSGSGFRDRRCREEASRTLPRAS
jgi:hypothetical protein